MDGDWKIRYSITYEVLDLKDKKTRKLDQSSTDMKDEFNDDLNVLQ